MAEDKARGMLDEEIERQFKLLRQTTDKESCEKYTENLRKLYALKLEEEKLDLDSDERTARFERENEDKEKELAQQEQDRKETRRDRAIRYVLDALGIVVPITFYGIWMERGFKFEENGHFTSTTFRSLMSKFKPTKK